MINFFITILALTITSFASAGVVVGNNKWNKSEVIVCWAVKGSEYHGCNGELHKHPFDNHALLSKKSLQKYRDLIKETVTNEFKKDVVGISFVGWEECPRYVDISSVADAMISLKVGRDSKANFGGGSDVGMCSNQGSRFLRIPTLGFSLYVGKWDKNYSFEDKIKIGTLHEFGHLAGLLHEDYIVDSPDTIIERNANIIGEYNPMSVMSYDFMNVVDSYGLKFNIFKQGDTRLEEWKHTPPSVQISEKGDVQIEPKLSSGDIGALRSLYFNRLKDIHDNERRKK